VTLPPAMGKNQVSGAHRRERICSCPKNDRRPDRAVVCAFHLAEYRYTDHPPRRRYSCVINGDGCCQWWQYEDVVLDASDFHLIGEALEATPLVIKGTVGSADATWIPLRGAVDFASAWLAIHRTT